MPAASNVQNMLGKVESRRPRRPKVSIVQIAGKAKRKFTNPKPNEAMSAVFSEAPPSLKMVEL